MPQVAPGDDLAALLIAALEGSGHRAARPRHSGRDQQDRLQGRGPLSRPGSLEPGEQARELAQITRKDARLVEAILSEATEVVRAKPNVLIVATRHGFVMANAGIDQSNLGAEDHGRRVLLLPQAPDDSARRLKERLDAHFGAEIGVILSDSVGRAWRLGTVGSRHRRRRRALAVGPARREGPFGPAAGGHRGRFRRCGCGHRRARHGRGGGGPPGRPRARARLERAGAPGGGPGAAESRGPVPMSREAPTYVALSGGVGGAKLSLGLAQLAGRPARHHRQHRRRLRAPGAAHLARCRHRALYALRPRQRGDRLGPARGDLDLHARARARSAGPTWFKLGDGDLATHVDRTVRLAAGEAPTPSARTWRRSWASPHACCP